jgi:hypothetical protein
MKVIIYCQKKDFKQIESKREKYVITHLDLKNEKPINIFGSNK